MTSNQPTMSTYPITSATQHQLSKPDSGECHLTFTLIVSDNRIPDAYHISPPPYPMATFTAGIPPTQATRASDNLNGDQQDNHSHTLSSGTASIKTKDSDKGNNTTTSDDYLNAEDATTSESLHPQPRAAQAPAVMLNTAPDSVTVNGVKYVLEQPNMIIPAIISATDSVQHDSIKPLKRVGNFTAGTLPVTYQPTVEKEPANGTNTQIHGQAAELVKQHSDMVSESTVTPATAGIVVGGGSADPSLNTPVSRRRHGGDQGDSYYE